MTYKNLIDLKEQRPQLYKRLVNWGLQRRKETWTRENYEYITKTTIESEIETYLDQLVFTPTKFSQAREKLIYWGSKLTDKEKQAVGLLLPYTVDFYDPTKVRSNALFRKNGFNPWYDLAESEEDKAILTTWYDGLYKVLDEKVIDKLTYKSENLGLITVNSYDAVILNTDNMMIIDIDLYTNNSPYLSKYPDLSINILHFLEEREGLNFRIYHTAGGLRAIETTKEWLPNSYTTKKLMNSVYADPLYVGLCWSQECFRARLTPKPWRHYELASDDYNWDTGEEWMNYIGHSEVAVCKLITDGSKPIDDKFFAAIEYHDRVTKALTAESDDLCLV